MVGGGISKGNTNSLKLKHNILPTNAPTTTKTQLFQFHALTFKVFNDFNVVQGQIQILQLLQMAKIFYKRKQTQTHQWKLSNPLNNKDFTGTFQTHSLLC